MSILKALDWIIISGHYKIIVFLHSFNIGQPQEGLLIVTDNEDKNKKLMKRECWSGRNKRLRNKITTKIITSEFAVHSAALCWTLQAACILKYILPIITLTYYRLLFTWYLIPFTRCPLHFTYFYLSIQCRWLSQLREKNVTKLPQTE